MNGYLLDTRTLVWAIDTPNVLSDSARHAIGEGPVFVNAVSLWELIIKRRKSSALLADPVSWWVRNLGGEAISILPISASHIAHLEQLPELHRDPFDRILLCQAAVEDLTLVSRDEAMALYASIAVVRA